jgi:transcriptional regulator with XRE-family HTH domain
MPRSFGKKLRHLRQHRRLTQTQLAHEVGLTSHTHISHMESGRKLPSLELVWQIACVMGVTTDYLLRDVIPVDASSEHRATYPDKVPSFLTHFSTKLRHLRRQRNMTQDDLAREVSYWTQAHISLLELGGSQPSIDLLLQLADLFQVSIDYLLNDSIPVE